MMSKKVGLLGILAGCFVALLALVACGPKTATLRAEMTDFKFSPDRWSVPAGAKVTLTLANSGALDHTWILMKKGAAVTTPFGDKDASNELFKATVKAGETQTFNFDAPTDPGDYEVVCGEPAHLEQGMKGTLTVSQ
jgi:plastocyanin